MKKNSGIALPSVMVLMFFIICFSLLLTTVILGSALSAKYQSTVLQKQVIVGKLRADFVADGQIDGQYDFDCEIVSNNQNQKALVVKRKNAINLIDFYYLCIYDFSQNKLLASQIENFAVSIKTFDNESFYYLAEIIQYKKI